jgi:hypothetical protein
MARKKNKPEEIDPGLAARRRLVSDKQVERTLAAGKAGKPSIYRPAGMTITDMTIVGVRESTRA